MLCLGLKLWSTNTGALMHAAELLFSERVYQYIELFVVPGSGATLAEWCRLKRDCMIPFVIHNAHSAQGFNLAECSLESRNRAIYAETQRFADALEADRIIFHGGMDGCVEETIRQLKSLCEPRAILENKPFVPLKNPLGLKSCRGATAVELSKIIAEVGCGFCLDIGHAICSANSQGLEPYAFVLDLARQLRPCMYHLSDVLDMSSVYDAHPHLGSGQLNMSFLKDKVLRDGSVVSIETVRDSMVDLSDFRRDIDFLRMV